MSADVLFALADGSTSWSDAIYNGSVIASGERSDLSALFAALAAGK
jgi:rare lipoprotein A (peptidoglycan hydrolase)